MINRFIMLVFTITALPIIFIAPVTVAQAREPQAPKLPLEQNNLEAPLNMTARQGMSGTAKVWVAHLAPFSNTLTGTTVSVWVDGLEAITDFQYSQSSDGYLDIALDGDATLVEIKVDGTTALSKTFELMDGLDYTVAANGDGINQMLNLLPLVDDNRSLTDAAKVRVIHTAPFTAGNAAVDILATADDSEIFADLSYGADTDYLKLPAGSYNLKVVSADTVTPTLIAIEGLEVITGEVWNLFAVGGTDDFNPTVKPLKTMDGVVSGVVSGVAQVKVAHFAPFAAGDASVTVQVDGQNLLTNFTFKDVEAYTPLPAGEHEIRIIPTGAVDAALVSTITVQSGVQYTLAAIGGANSSPLALKPIVDDNRKLVDMAKIRVAHLAPFAETVTDTLVDIRDEAGNVVGGLAGVPYEAVSDYLELPAGTYDLKITTPGGEKTIIDVPPLTVLAGDVTTVVAVGDGTNQMPMVVKLGDGQLSDVIIEKGRLKVAHLAPFAPDRAAVDIKINGNSFLSDFAYGDVTTSYTELNAGVYTVTIIPQGLGTAQTGFNFTTTIIAGDDVTLAIVGDVTNQPLEMLPLVDDNTPPSGSNAKLRIVHAAPFTNSLSATEVDIRTEAGDVVDGLTNVPYKGLSGYFELEPGAAYDLKITAPGGETTLIDLPPVELQAGGIATVYAIGDGTNQTLSVLPDGDITVVQPMNKNYLPIVIKN